MSVDELRHSRPLENGLDVFLILNPLPVRAKVKVNYSPILLPLQGVGTYTLIPRSLPWDLDWLPFQGAPFRALFVYHVRMLRHFLFGSKPRRDFSIF